jgi:alkylation response protein AidB-like acyl-CoA dehydrogenase
MTLQQEGGPNQWDTATLFAADSEPDRQFRQNVRKWVTANCPENLRHRSSRFTPDELKPWHRKLFEKGWVAPHWPKEFGGMGGTVVQQLILYEEIGRAGAPVPLSHGLNLIGPLIIEVGTDEQKATHLPPILAGEVTWCQGYSEPGAGSDLASLSTRAEFNGAEFLVNGHKTWTTHGHRANWMFALVRTDPNAQPRHAGISMLLIDMKSPGITVHPIRTLRGDMEFAEEFFDNVRVPKENLLGRLNQGWELATLILGAERLLTGHPRIAARILDIIRQVARISGALADAAFRDRLAILEIELVALSAFFRHGISLHAAKRAPVSLSPTVRVAGAELAQRATELMMEAAGIRGVSIDDLPVGSGSINVAAELFEARRLTVGSGSVEIQKNIIAKRVLGLPS